MKKQTWQERLVRRFFGMQGTIDEQGLAVLGRASINAVIGLLGFQFVVVLAAVVWPLRHYENAYFTLLTIELMGSIWVIWLTVSRTLHSSGLDQKEVTPAQYPQAKRHVRQKWLVLALPFTCSYHLVVSLLALNERPLLASLGDRRQLFASLFFGVIMCPLLYYLEVRRIRVVEDDL